MVEKVFDHRMLLPPLLPCLYLMQSREGQFDSSRRAIRLIGDLVLTCHLQPLSHQRAVGDISLFYRY
nr:unnamed protein product [Callosobruchus chinensis]